MNYEKFQEIIREALKFREDKLLKKKHMVIDIDSRFASILKILRWYQVSKLLLLFFIVTKGKSHHLLRKKLLLDEREEANRIIKKKYEAFHEFRSLQEKISSLKEELKQRDEELKQTEEAKKFYDLCMKMELLMSTVISFNFNSSILDLHLYTSQIYYDFFHYSKFK